jgi:hypothetical protein
MRSPPPPQTERGLTIGDDREAIRSAFLHTTEMRPEKNIDPPPPSPARIALSGSGLWAARGRGWRWGI